MDIGIGLPTAHDDVDRSTVLQFARRADAAGFSSLAAIDRLVFHNWEPLISLAAAAAVTERINIMTSVLLAPLRVNAALFAKETATLDRLSEGRLVLGLAVGGRADDYAASGVDIARRGAIFDEQLRVLRDMWSGQRGIGPAPARRGGPELVIGGTSDAAIRRVVEHEAGWISGGGGAGAFRETAQRVLDAWQAAGLSGRPRLRALAYFSLGDNARAAADAYLQHYYGFLGPVAQMIAKGALVGADRLRSAIDEFAEAGCDELILFPSSPSPDQVDLLAAARR